VRGEQWILDQRPAILAFLRRDALQPLQFPLRAAHAGNIGSFVSEQKLGVGPALVFIANAILDRHPHILEPDLIDLMAAVQQRDGSHRDAGAFHIDQ
jgi:hypothetical protein